MLKLFSLLNLAILLLVTLPTHAQVEVPNWWPPGSILDLGVRVSRASLKVKSLSGSDTLGELSSLAQPTPSLTLSSPFNYWGSGRFGYKFKAGFSWFSVNKQKVGSEIVDVGTKADGYSLYGTPVIGYLIGDSSAHSTDKRSLLLGLGVGAGYSSTTGEILFTEDPTNPPVHKFEFDRFSLAALLIADAKWNSWSFGLQVGGPTLNDSNFKYEIFDVSVQVAYTLEPENFANLSTNSNHEGLQISKQTYSDTSMQLFIGARDLPVVSTQEITPNQNKSGVGGIGLTLNFHPEIWPLELVADLAFFGSSPHRSTTSLLTPGQLASVSLEAKMIETQIGFSARKDFSNKWSMAFLGGITVYHFSIEGTINGDRVKDSGLDFGYWVGGDLKRQFGGRFFASIEARLINSNTDFLGLFEENTFGSFRINIGSGI